MIRLCNQCKCELNSENTAKKDATRFRKICRACFRKNRYESRITKEHNQTKHLHDLIEQNIVKIDFDPFIIQKDAEEDGFFKRVINVVKNLIKEINNGLY